MNKKFSPDKNIIRVFGKLINIGELLLGNLTHHPRKFQGYAYISDEPIYTEEYYIADFNDFQKWKTECLLLLTKVLPKDRPVFQKQIQDINKYYTNKKEHIAKLVADLKGMRDSYKDGILEVSLNVVQEDIEDKSNSITEIDTGKYQLFIDEHNKKAFYRGKPLELQPLPFKLLSFMAFRKKEKTGIVSRNDIYNHLWDYAYDNYDSQIEATIAKIRLALRKVKVSDETTHKLIKTRKKVGYELKISSHQIIIKN